MGHYKRKVNEKTIPSISLAVSITNDSLRDGCNNGRSFQLKIILTRSNKKKFAGEHDGKYAKKIPARPFCIQESRW